MAALHKIFENWPLVYAVREGVSRRLNTGALSTICSDACQPSLSDILFDDDRTRGAWKGSFVQWLSFGLLIPSVLATRTVDHSWGRVYLRTAECLNSR